MQVGRISKSVEYDCKLGEIENKDVPGRVWHDFGRTVKEPKYAAGVMRREGKYEYICVENEFPCELPPSIILPGVTCERGTDNVISCYTQYRGLRA